MSAKLSRSVVFGFALSVLLLSGSGCASNANSDKPAAQDIKPMDRVREGIVSLSSKLSATLSSAEASVGAPVTGTASGNLKDNLRETQSAVQTLRADCNELKQRADEYLILWSPQSATVTSAGKVVTTTNERRQQSKATYDQMVSSLQQARDELIPLMTDLQNLQTASLNRVADRSALQADAGKARQRGNSAIAHLNAAVTSLDELKAMLNTQNTRPG